MSATALDTDLYQLTMAAGYRHAGIAAREAVFHLSFRRPPFGGGYALACGLEAVADYLAGWHFAADDLDYLRRLTGNDGRPLFERGFLRQLGVLRFTGDVDAVAEGTAVFAHAPLLRLRAPLLQAQLLETPLLNRINFATLIATKASRVCAAAGGDPVLEFGLRRAQGPDGGLTASRAAYLGGCAATSNLEAGRRFGIPVRGTHAHSWVMSFDGDAEAFAAWAAAMPNNGIFLVDTHDTLDGVRQAIVAARALAARGHAAIGVRLDSGDLVALSRAARRLLDDAGFAELQIVASDDLDEHAIAALKAAGAAIDIWGVGTRLATAWDQPALGGVYKLGAWREAGVSGDGNPWRRVMKRSAVAAKASIPGLLQVRRLEQDGRFLADVIWDTALGTSGRAVALDDGAPLPWPPAAETSDLLQPLVRGGRPVASLPSLDDARRRARAQLVALDPAIRRLRDPAAYPLGLDCRLHAERERLRAAPGSQREG